MKKQDIANNDEGSQKSMDEQTKVVEEYTNTLKRLQADFENYIKRAEKDREEFANYANHKLITRLLTIADDFDKALETIKKEDNKFAQGIEMIHKQFHKILQEEGVTKIDSVGNKLDPYKHDVVDVVKGNDDNIIVEELQKGYMIKNKVLRPSKVRISKSLGSKWKCMME